MRASDSIWYRGLLVPALATLLGSCAAYGPYHANSPGEPLNSVRGPSDGRYKFAFIEFGDQGSALDMSQRAAAINVIRQAQRPLLFVYIHGWMNNANSGDVCRFEHFIDMVSRLPEVTQGNINVIGVYIAWRGKDLTFPGLNLLTFWNRKSTGNQVAAQNSCLATINELALAAREPGKQVHHCVLMGHSFGGLVLSSTISHSILDASSTGARNASPWDMAVAFNPADNAIGTRQLLSELDYLYKYDSTRDAYVGRTPGAEEGAVVNENRPFLVILQSENDQATGTFFPIGQSLANNVNLHYHWDKVPVPGSNGQKISEGELQTHTPGNDKYLVNFHEPHALKAKIVRTVELNHLVSSVRGVLHRCPLDWLKLRIAGIRDLHLSRSFGGFDRHRCRNLSQQYRIFCLFGSRNCSKDCRSRTACRNFNEISREIRRRVSP